MIVTALMSGIVAGLFSTPHCAAMCGPLCAFACGPATRSAWLYQLGRTASYSALGAVAGLASSRLASLLAPTWATAFLSWLFAAGLLVVAWRLVRPAEGRSAIIRVGTKQSRRSWRSRGASYLIAAARRNPFAVGVASAFLPCGALAAALVLATATGSTLGGTIVMLGFATTTALALFAVRWVHRRFSQRARGPSTWGLAAVFVVSAALLIYRPIPTLVGPEHGAPTCPLHAETSLTQLETHL